MFVAALLDTVFVYERERKNHSEHVLWFLGLETIRHVKKITKHYACEAVIDEHAYNLFQKVRYIHALQLLLTRFNNMIINLFFFFFTSE